MAKIWIPKSWSGTNPPSSGTRVFVGGKGGGKSVYESLSTGQTKRCLQSNGRGNIFYGNVSIIDPTAPSTSSDVNLQSIPSIEVTFIAKTAQGEYGVGYLHKTATITNGYITQCECGAITRPTLNDWPPDNYNIGIKPRSGYGWGDIAPSDLKSIKKISLKLNNGLYVVYFVNYTSTNGSVYQYRLDNGQIYTNINANIGYGSQEQMSDWFNSQGNGYICLNKTR